MVDRGNGGMILTGENRSTRREICLSQGAYPRGRGATGLQPLPNINIKNHRFCTQVDISRNQPLKSSDD
jgi:hypothetical protein